MEIVHPKIKWLCHFLSIQIFDIVKISGVQGCGRWDSRDGEGFTEHSNWMCIIDESQGENVPSGVGNIRDQSDARGPTQSQLN